MRKKLKALLSVLVVCLAVVIARRDGLLSDRVWWDEVYVVLGANGLPEGDELPLRFSSQDVPGATWAASLRQLAAADAYPPLVYSVAHFSAKLGDPIKSPRWVFVAVTSAAAVAMLATAWRLKAAGALIATILAFSSTALVDTGSDVKWSAVTPGLTAVSSLALLRALSRDSALAWGLYAASAVLCLHAHYFMLSLIPAHATYVLVFNKERFRSWLSSAALVAALSAPWYLWALPQQQQYVSGFFSSLSAGANPNPIWKQPLTVPVWATWMAYNVLAALGFQPSSVRSLALAPVALTLMIPIIRSVARVPSPTRAIVVLASIQLGAALLAQSLYALRLGHTTPLTWAYFVSWYPLLLFGLGLAAMAGGHASRVAVVLLLVWTSAHALLVAPDESRYTDSLDHRRQLAARAADWARGDAAALVHRTNNEARLFNLYYRGNLPQMVCVKGCSPAQVEGLQRLVVLSPAVFAEAQVGPGWRLIETYPLGRSRVTTYQKDRNVLEPS